MKVRARHSIITMIIVLCAFFAMSGIAMDNVYAKSNNESGSVVVIIGDGTVFDYSNRFRDAWNFCDEHPGCTIKLTSDLKLNKEMSTGGRLAVDTNIKVDLNGFTIDCQNKCRAFNVFRNGTLKIIDSSSSKTGKIVNGNENWGGAIRSTGITELDGITIEKCKSNSALTGGGAIYVWTTNVYKVQITDPHVVINNCIIKDCSAYTGGAIESHIDTIEKLKSPVLSNPLSGEAALEAVKKQENDESEGGDSFLISNTTIQNCNANKGGGINVAGAATIDNCQILNCNGGYAGGGVCLNYGASFKMFNSTISGCRADGSGGGNGGGIYIQSSAKGEAGGDASKVEIWGGQIINNAADDGSGIYFPTGSSGDSTLTIGGELIVKDNRDFNGKLDNIEFETTKITFFKEGLYGKADVGVGSDDYSDEAKVGDTASFAIAKETVKHIKADHLKKIYNEDFKGEERLGSYTKNKEASVYIGISRKIELINFELTGDNRSQYKAEINRDTKEITVRFPFSEGYQPGGIFSEPFRVTWDSGYGGTICMLGEGMREVSDKPYNNAVITYHNLRNIDKTICIKCGGAEENWTVHFVNEGETRCTISVTNGYILNFLPTREYGDTKQYRIPVGKEIKIIANEPEEGQVFDYWGYVNRGIVPHYEFNDFYSSTTTIVAPASKGRMAGLVFTANYRDVATVEVINGTHTDGSTEKNFKPGEHVKVTADSSLKNFDHWEVVKGNLTLSETQAKSRVLEFDMGYTDIDNPSSGRYGDITVKAVYLSVDKPVASPASGEYIGNQKVQLSCATKNSVIYYSLNGSEYTKYENKPIELTVRTDEQQRKYTLNCYSVLTNEKGAELIKSDIVTEKYTITNSNPKIGRTLKIINGKTSDGKAQIVLYAGTKVTVKANTAPIGKFFKSWKVVAGSISLTDEQLSSSEMSFTMPNNDITLEAVYEDAQILPYKAKATNGTLNGLTKTLFFEGTKVTAAASPSVGMSFDHWEAVGITLSETDKKSPVFTFYMPANDISLKAVFKVTPVKAHSLTVSNGYLENDEEKVSGEYRPDERVYVSGKPSGDTSKAIYKFNHWEIVNAPEDFKLSETQKYKENITINMPDGDVSLKAIYDVVESSNTVYVINGTIGKTKDQIKNFKKGETVTINAAPSGGMTFEEWTAIGISLGSVQKYKANNMSFTMPDNDVVLIANYASTPVEPYQLLTIDGNNKAKLTPQLASELASYAENTTVAITAINPGKDDEYKFVRWSIEYAPDGWGFAEKTSMSTDVTMPAGNVVLRAVWAKKHSATVVKGTVNGKASINAYEGDTLVVQCKPSAGMVFDHWESCGIALTETQRYAESFTTSMTDDDVIFEAIYKASPIEPNMLFVENGTIITELDQKEGKTEGSYFEGSVVIVRADTIANKAFDHWESDGIEFSEEESHQAMLTITMPNNEVTVTAVYKTLPTPPSPTPGVDTGDTNDFAQYPLLGLFALAGIGLIGIKRKVINHK